MICEDLRSFAVGTPSLYYVCGLLAFPGRLWSIHHRRVCALNRTIARTHETISLLPECARIP